MVESLTEERGREMARSLQRFESILEEARVLQRPGEGSGWILLVTDQAGRLTPVLDEVDFRTLTQVLDRQMRIQGFDKPVIDLRAVREMSPEEIQEVLDDPRR